MATEIFQLDLQRDGETIDRERCDVGNLLPTIAELLQRYEAREPGIFVPGTTYSIEWRRYV